MSSAAPAASTETHNLNAQPFLVRRAAVLGAGTMGSRIAAHLANAGIPVLLLDLAPEGARRAKLAHDRHRRPRPNPNRPRFYDPALAALITPGNFDDDLPKLAALRLGHRSRHRKSRHQGRPARTRRAPHRAPTRCSPPTPPACPSQRSRHPCPRRYSNASSAPTSSIRRATCRLLEIIPTPSPTRTPLRLRRLRRPPPRQADRLRQRHAQLHRQPHRRQSRLHRRAISCLSRATPSRKSTP